MIEVSCSVHHFLDRIIFSVIVLSVYLNVSHLISFPQTPVIQSKKRKDSKLHLANRIPGNYAKSWVRTKEVNNHLLSCAFNYGREVDLPILLVF